MSDLLDLVFGPEEDKSKSFEAQTKVLDDEPFVHSVGGFNQIFPYNEETAKIRLGENTDVSVMR